jgi:DNA processing protein
MSPLDNDLRPARIALGYLVEPGNRDLGELVLRFGPIEALGRLRAGDVTDALRQATAPRLAGLELDHLADRAMERAERLGARIITPEDDEWPGQLHDLVRLSVDGPDRIRRDTLPPQCLWLRGSWPLAGASTRSVSIVGARASTPYGEHIAADLAFGLADRGWTITSGGAFGIDAAAHRGALAGAGCTIAVLACGIDRPYPQSHASLFEQIAAHGLLLSEWPPGADPHRHRFLIRNRVIAAISGGTILIEANLRSGARFTLNRARDLGRIVMATPGPITSAMSAGSHEELRTEGTTLVCGVAHVIDAVGRIGADLAPTVRAEETAQDRLTPVQQQVLDGVRPRKILDAEQIAAAVGVSARDARRALPSLEQAGFVTATAGGYRLFRTSDAKPGG